MIETNWTNTLPMNLESMASYIEAPVLKKRVAPETLDFCNCYGECEFEEFAFVKADGLPHQTDKASFIEQKVFSADTVTFKLLKNDLVVATLNDATYGDYADFGAYTGNLNAKSIIVDWYLVQQAFGYGKFKVRTEIVSLGETITIDSHAYKVMGWNPYAADGTVKIETYQKGFIMNGFNYSDMDFYQSIRILGKFGYKTPELIVTNYKDTNRKVIPIQDEIVNTYKLMTELLPSSVFNPLNEDKLLGNVIIINDCNIKNQEIFHNKEVVLTAIPTVENHEGSIRADFVFEFKDRTQDIIKRTLTAL